MNCQRIANDELAERYLNGQLAPAMQGDFEIHLLECTECLERTETLRMIRASLKAETQKVFLLPTKQARAFRWDWFGVAATLLLAGLLAGYQLKLQHRDGKPSQAANNTVQARPSTATAVPVIQQESTSEPRLTSQSKRKDEASRKTPTLNVRSSNERTMASTTGFTQVALYRQNREVPYLELFVPAMKHTSVVAEIREEYARELIARQMVFGPVNR